MSLGSLSSDITNKHEQEFQRLRLSRGRLIRLGLLLGVALLLVGIITVALRSGNDPGLEAAQKELLGTGTRFATQMVESQQSYSTWLSRRGTKIEVALLESVAEALFVSAARVSTPEQGLLRRMYSSIHAGVLRVTFLVLATWRFLASALVFAAIYSFWRLRVHNRADLLGHSGNGRLFYSGIRANLRNVNKDGAPEDLVIGLACPPRLPLSSAKSTELARILEKHSALNDTNLALVSIIAKHADFPAYISEAGVASESLKLLENTSTLINTIFSLKQSPRELPSTLDHLKIISSTLARVHSETMQKVLSDISPKLLATLVLGLEAGKVMTFSYEGSRWLRRSNFPQLNARAILHSIPSFSADYDYETRSIVRRALVYGSRKSAFGAVRFPVDLHETSRVLRQWVEVLLAAPEELEAVGDEVELFGLLDEAHRAWTGKILGGALIHDQDIKEEAYATDANLFFLPLQIVLKLLRSIVPKNRSERIAQLLKQVSSRLQTQQQAVLSEEERSTPFAKLLLPISNDDLKRIASEHELKLDDLREWSSLRTILESFGWLARRVGDYTVPASSIIFGVFKVEVGNHKANQLGLIGRPGMVAFRATRLAQQWGRLWQRSFAVVEVATMAESRTNYERLLKGIVDSDDEDANVAVG